MTNFESNSPVTSAPKSTSTLVQNSQLDYLSVADYDYNLPDQLIARYPLEQRSDSKLLYVATPHDTNVNSDKSVAILQDKLFTQLPDLLNAGDLIVFNDTKVMKARLFGQKDTGGKVEVLIERLTDDVNDGKITYENVALCHVRASKSPKVSQRIFLADGSMQCEVIGRQENLFVLSFDSDILPDLERYGEMPIPPYFERHADETDNTRYQTVFHDPAKTASVAAPTASLHFDDDILQALEDKGVQRAFVTLHVGAGTFAPVKHDNLLEHTMHSEYAHLSEQTAQLINDTHARGNKVIAVGTTVTRVLESAFLYAQKTVTESQNGDDTDNSNVKGNEISLNKTTLSAWSGDTEIFIYPGFEFKVIDRLLTNFHLPKSTLLMLVSAFTGKDNIERAYKHAIEQQYRFFSYGDAMLLDKILMTK